MYWAKKRLNCPSSVHFRTLQNREQCGMKIKLRGKRSLHLSPNSLTLRSDQHVNSLYIIHTLSIIEVLRILKLIR